MERACLQVDSRGSPLIGHAVIVLDEIQAAQRHAPRQIGQTVGRQSLGLERRTGQRPIGRSPNPGAQAGRADIGPAEAGQKIVGQIDIKQDGVVLQRGVAKQHVEKLTGIAADGGGRQGESHLEAVLAALGDLLDHADDAVENRRVIDGRERHFNALLNGDSLGPGLDRRRRRLYPIGRAQSVRHAMSPAARRRVRSSERLWRIRKNAPIQMGNIG